MRENSSLFQNAAVELAPYVPLLTVLDVRSLVIRSSFIFSSLTGLCIGILLTCAIVALSLLLYLQRERGRKLLILVGDFYCALMLPLTLVSLFKTHTRPLWFDIYSLILSLIFFGFVMLLTDNRIKELFKPS